MDHFESIVIDYLRADRSLFLNTQCCIQLHEGSNPDTSGPHWYCDAVAVSVLRREAFLCEITYATPPNSLFKRLTAWNSEWPMLRAALERDSGIPATWPVTPWVFVPDATYSRVSSFIDRLEPTTMPRPALTRLEDVLPWKYRSWNRVPAEHSKPGTPPNLQHPPPLRVKGC